MTQYHYLDSTQVQQLVMHVQDQILESPALINKDALTALGFNVITGTIFKDLQYLKLKKGNNARNYGVSTKDEDGGNVRVKTIQRELTVYHSWDRIEIDTQNFREKEPFVISAESYDPDTLLNSLKVIKDETEGYAADIFAGLFWGVRNPSGASALSIYDGVMTIIKKKIENEYTIATPGTYTSGLTKKETTVDGRDFEMDAAKQIVACDPFTDVDSTDPSANWDNFVAWLNGMPDKMRNNKDGIVVYMDAASRTRLINSYGRTYPSLTPQTAKLTVSFEDSLPNVTICSHLVVGKGDMLLATTKGNFDFGIDSEGNLSKVSIEVMGSVNNNLMALQIDSTQGCRVRYFDAAHIYWNGKVNTFDTSLLGDF